MSEMTFVHPLAWSGEPEALVRTETGHCLHIPACPHIRGGISRATSDELDTMPVCTWCQAELDGAGRTYFDQIEDAMRVFGTWAGTEQRIKAELHAVVWDSIWVPNSRSYVALGHQGKGVAWFGKTYVVPARGEFVELPDYKEVHGGGARRDERVGATCPNPGCNYQLPLTGVCDFCW